MRRIMISVVGTAIFLSVALGAAFAGGGTDKIEMCHMPPGNPNNGHTLSVGNPAMPDHMAHGDYYGSCENGSGYGYGYQ